MMVALSRDSTADIGRILIRILPMDGFRFTEAFLEITTLTKRAVVRDLMWCSSIYFDLEAIVLRLWPTFLFPFEISFSGTLPLTLFVRGDFFLPYVYPLWHFVLYA